jgi:hypothetical protein
MADISVTAASVKIGSASTTAQLVQYGATVTQSQPVYSDATDSNKYKPADAEALASAAATGMALTPGASGDYGLIVTDGLFNPGGTVVVGQVYVVSTNPGGIAPYGDLGSGDFVTILGVGSTTSLIDISINATGIAKA